VGSDPNLAIHVWNNGVDGAEFGSNEGGLASWWGVSFRCLTDNTDCHVFDCRTKDSKFKGALSNTGNASFSSNVVVGSGLTAYLLTTTDLYADNTISAQGRISSGGDIMSQFNGGGNVGTSGNPWGSVNTLTASLGNATMTSLSKSGVISMNYGDGDKIVLTNVGTNASKITHSSGWGVGYFAGSTTGTSGQHNFYTATIGSWANPMYISGTAVNVTNKLAVNQSVDSGVNRGIYWWNDGDANWTSYFASSGGTRLSSGGAACTALDGRTAHHHRARVGNSATQGFLWKNASEQCLMSLTADTGNLYVRSSVQTSNITVGQTLTVGILKGSLDCNYLSYVPSLGTSAQSTFASNAGVFGSNSGAFGSNSAVWSSNNCVKGSSLSNASYPIMITSTTPRLGLLWNGGTSGSLDFGFSTSAFQGSNGAFAKIRADDNNYLASLSFQTRTSGSDNSNMLIRIVIQSTGNVGINTTSPGCLLDVAGLARFVDTAITGLLTCSNGLAMKTNTWMTGTDNTNRMYFATSADTTFSSPNGQYNFLNNTGATSVQITSNLGLNYPQSDPGFFCSSFYGTKPSLDIYGYGQFLTGTVRAIISGSYSAASFRVCRPFNTNYTSWTDLLTVDSSGNTAATGIVSGTNLNLNSVSVTSNQIKIGYTVNTPGSSVTLGRGWFSFSSAGWTAISTGSTFCPVSSNGMDNWVGKLKVAVKNAQTTSPNTWYAEYTLNKLYGYNILVSASQGKQTFGFPGCSIVASGGTGLNNLTITANSGTNVYYSWSFEGSH
jgi:hypothetical protein